MKEHNLPFMKLEEGQVTNTPPNGIPVPQLPYKVVSRMSTENQKLGLYEDSDSMHNPLIKGSNPKDLVGQSKDYLSLLTREFLHGTARAMKYGAFEAKRKDGKLGYGPYNWRQSQVRFSIYLDAILRHTIALADGEELDPDSGLPHEDHIAANINIIKDAKKHGKLLDDRLDKRTL